jgi:hypothetical protein
MPDLTAVFAALREVIAPYAATLDTRQDCNSGIYVDTRHIPKKQEAPILRHSTDQEVVRQFSPDTGVPDQETCRADEGGL